MSSRPGSQRLSEFALIEKVFAPLAGAKGAYGLKDDAATLALPAGRELVVTADALVEGVHFLRGDPAATVGRKALRVNLSDLAAKGAQPHVYLLTIALPGWTGQDWLEEFAAGLAADQKLFGVTLTGGDTTATDGPLTLSITALGSVPAGKMIRRAGAAIGDAVFVTGTIGDAGAGLAALEGEGMALGAPARAASAGRYRVPEPRVALGPRLLGVASAAVDVSDGLLADLGHVADASGVRIVVEAARVPLSPPVVALWGGDARGVARAASCGDDYEIAFTAPPAARDAIAALARETGVPISEIGRVEKGRGIGLLDNTGAPVRLEKHGFTHF